MGMSGQWQGHRVAVYLLVFPSDLRADQITAWLHAVWGTLGAGSSAPLVHEVLQTDRGVHHFLSVPRPFADYMIGQLRVHVPNVHAAEVEPPTMGNWTYVVRLGERNSK